ncbi:hypothetical protein PINS_up016575 [Pythium insidiosum]|nr:hypothetical protein PINS_up016575 [Pythium insidiosum]
MKTSTKSRRGAKDKTASVPIPEPSLMQPRITQSEVTVKPIKIRNGVSLADLKEEHRAALAILEELGGPVESRKREPRLKKSNSHWKEPTDGMQHSRDERERARQRQTVKQWPPRHSMRLATCLADCTAPDQQENDDQTGTQDSVWDRYAEDPADLGDSDAEKSISEDDPAASADSGDLYADEAFERD